MLIDNSFNEKQILQQLSHGSEAAFEKIYTFYSQRLYGKLLKLLKSEVIAEEIVQDVFLIIWDNRSNLNPEKSFSSYLFCIATNKCYDHYRKLKRDKNLFLRLNQTQNYSNTIEQGIVNKESSGILHKAIESLPSKRKLIFTLCKIECKTYSEVSRLLGISLSTISDHIVKANHFIKARIIIGNHLAIDDFLQK